MRTYDHEPMLPAPGVEGVPADQCGECGEVHEVSESRIYPYADGMDTVYACCESTIGPLCEHLRSKPEQEIDVSTETPVKFNNKLEELP